jgi:hypothetical protein
MTTAKRISNIFNAIKTKRIDLVEGKLKYSCYLLEIKKVDVTEVNGKEGWFITVYYKKEIIGTLTFDNNQSGWKFDYFYPFASLKGNKLFYPKQSSGSQIIN